MSFFVVVVLNKKTHNTVGLGFGPGSLGIGLGHGLELRVFTIRQIGRTGPTVT